MIHWLQGVKNVVCPPSKDMFQRLPGEDKYLYSKEWIPNLGLTHQREKEMWPWGFHDTSPPPSIPHLHEFIQCVPLGGTTSLFYSKILNSLGATTDAKWRTCSSPRAPAMTARGGLPNLAISAQSATPPKSHIYQEALLWAGWDRARLPHTLRQSWLNLIPSASWDPIYLVWKLTHCSPLTFHKQHSHKPIVLLPLFQGSSSQKI